MISTDNLDLPMLLYKFCIAMATEFWKKNAGTDH